MKVIITHLKAPWPEGAKVGDVVEFDGDTAPAWAAGKFTLTDPGAKNAIRYVPAKPVDPAEAADTGAAAGMASAQQYLDDLRTAHSNEVAELRQIIADGSQALADVTAERDALLERLTAADTDDGKAAAALKDADAQAAAEKEKAAAKGAKKG